ncbi:unnamed protein product [Urochloa humidicola]
MVRQKRRLRLRLPSPPPPQSEHSESEHDDPVDDDFAPHAEIQVVEQGCNRKRRRHQSRGGSSMHGTSPALAPAPGPPPAPVAIPADPKKKTIQAIRCSPSKFRDIVKALDDSLKDAVRAKNFGGLLDFKPHALDRQLLSWLMRKLNADTMTLELNGDQRISITQHTVWCVFQLPRDGGGPPEMTDAQARLRRRQLAGQITGEESDRISPSDIEKLFASRTLAGDIGLRAFFMCAFQSLLFSNSSCYIRLDDVKYTEDMENIGQMNWCKVVVDNINKAARLYKVDFESKGMAAPISGCGIFLVMLYIDFLQHGYDLNPFALPRCAHLETNMIDRISSEDRRGDVAPGVILNFGHLRLKNINDTCYRLPHPALAVGAVPIAPAARFESYPGPSTSARPSTSDCTSQQHASHDPGGQAGFNFQPPGPVKYPSLSAVFGQGIIDVVGRSRKSQAMKILEDFDASALEAQSLEAEAVSFMNRASLLMSKAHHECYTGIQKLIEDAKVEKQAVNAARRGRQNSAVAASGMPPATDQDPRHAAEVQQLVADPDQRVAHDVLVADTEHHVHDDGAERHEDGGPFDAQPLDTRDDDMGSGGGYHGSDDFMNTVISTPTALRGPCSGVDSIIFNMYSSDFVHQEPQHRANPERQLLVVNTEESMFGIHIEEMIQQQSVDGDGTQEPNREGCVHVQANNTMHQLAFPDVDVDGMQRLPEATDPVEDTGRFSADVDMIDAVHTELPVHEPSQLEGDGPNKDVVNETTGAAGDTGPADEIHVAEHEIVDTTEHDTVVIQQEHGTVDSTRLDVPTEVVQVSHVAEQPQLATYHRRTTRVTRATERKKAADEQKQTFEEEAGLVMSEKQRQERDAHERWLEMLREDAEQEIDQLKSTVDVLAGPSAPAPDQVFPEDSAEDIYSQSPPVRLSQEERLRGADCYNHFQRSIYKKVGDRLRKRPRRFILPFKIAGSRPKVPKERALAMRNRIANDENLQEMTRIDFSVFLSYDGKDLLTTFADDKFGESNLLDYIVHCLRYDDIVHKQESIGYRVFLTTGLWTAAQDVVKEYMDDGKTETEPFKIMREHLEVQTEHYDVTKAKLIFMPACDGHHYFLYCINLIHNRIDILDSIDYWWTRTDYLSRHQPVWDMPLINQAFKKITKGKFPTFYNWSRPFISVPKQAGPSDCMFFVWKYMEFWDGDRLNIKINPFLGMIYRIEMMHYTVFHALNQADLPDVLDIFRLGGRKIEFDQSQ